MQEISWPPASAESRVVLHWLAADVPLRLIDVDRGGRQWHPKAIIRAKPGEAPAETMCRLRLEKLYRQL